MSLLNITLRETSQAVLPTLKGDNHVLWAYDGELAELPWRESLLEQAQALALQAGDSADLFAQECGASGGQPRQQLSFGFRVAGACWSQNRAPTLR